MPPKSDGLWIFFFFQTMTKELKKNNNMIRFDLASDKGKQTFSAVEAPATSLEIIHPVYRYNIAEALKNEKILEVIVEEFSRAFDILRDNSEERIKTNLCAEFRR